MANPTKILVSLDLSNESEQVIAKAVEMATLTNASLLLMHVVEPVITDSNYVLPDTYIDLESTLVKRAEDFLSEAAGKISSINVGTCVDVGSIKSRVYQKVDNEGIDLIIMGTHGRHGFARILGSTASAMLHGTPCDVYMVKIKEST